MNKIICVKCGSANVACEAFINPNTKDFKRFTCEAFEYGYCYDCGDSSFLTDVDEVLQDIKKNYEDYKRERGKEPAMVSCRIVWKDTFDELDVLIRMSEELADNDNFFFYCFDLSDLESLVDVGMNEFIIIQIYNFQ